MLDHSRDRPVLSRIQKILDIRIFLAFIAVIYAFGFSRYPAAPGNNPEHPLGWWGWFDQGQYLLSSQAFAAWDFSAAQHFCPPLYSLLGAVFVRFTDPFWLINLVCLLWFATVFVCIARRYVPNWVAMLIFIVMVVVNRRIFENFLIPWTSTLSTALLATGLYAYLRLCERLEQPASFRDQPLPGVLGCFSVSLALGMLFPLRPLDSLLGGLVWLACLMAGQRLLRRDGQGNRIGRNLMAAVSGWMVGPLFYVLFNWLVFGTPFMNDYVEDSMLNGYFPADFGEKFVSIFLNGYSLYFEPRSGIIEHYPFLLLLLPALIFVAVYGDALLRLIGLLVCLQFILYLPYGDLLPTGLWRYMNIHYFKWTFPFLALFIWYAVAAMIRQWRVSPPLTIGWVGVFGILSVLLLSLDFKLTLQPVPTPQTSIQSVGTGASSLHRIVWQHSGETIDFIDLTGLDGDFTDVYFGEHALWLDGRLLRRVRDYRVLPAPWGVRVLFIRPVRARAIIFQPDIHLTLHQEALQSGVGQYRIILGPPRFSSRKG